jgi:UDP-N-acetylglucosamine 2-epimerase (non-hydrolysing)
VIKVLTIFGTRPEAIKLAPVVGELERHPDRIEPRVCVTGQHREMLDQVLGLFGIVPHRDLALMEQDQTLPDLTANVIRGVDEVVAEEQPDTILVQGDTTTVFAASLAAFYRQLPVAHVEAGLRTQDKYNPFPEEINRRLVSHLADLHFAPTERARRNLLAEGIPDDDIVVTGNTVIDALLSVVRDDYVFQDPVLRGLDFDGQRVVLLTAHRRESFGAPLQRICAAVRELVACRDDVEVVYPVHLNPNVRRTVMASLDGHPRIHLVEPLSYEPFLQLMSRAYLILTDSGGIQEEAPSLGKPVLVLREVTERPEAVEAGAARLVGTDREAIVRHTLALLDDEDAYDSMARVANPFGDGKASERIVQAVLTRFADSTRG